MSDVREGIAKRLQSAVDAVYDAHGVPARRRIAITNHPWAGNVGALNRAKVVADAHYFHAGDWEPGSCDGELFALEWQIHVAETLLNTPRRSLLADARQVSREAVERFRAALG
jgi:hypothetical protein